MKKASACGTVFLLKSTTQNEAKLNTFDSHLDDLLRAFAPAFTKPTFQTFAALAKGCVLAPRRRTTTGMLRAAGEIVTKHFSTYHRFWSSARWDAWTLAWILVELILPLVSGRIRILVDDTTSRRWGPHVWGKSCHRDAVRSTQKHTILCFGHKWVTLSVAVKLPFTSRPWALPIASLLYQSKKNAVRHRKLERLAMIMLYRLMRRFPEQTFEVVGDGGYSSNELSLWCHKMKASLIARLRVDSVLYDEPPTSSKGKRGRPRKKGNRQPSFEQLVATAKEEDWTYTEVQWYAGATKKVRWMSGTGLRYKPKTNLPAIRWVLVQDTETDHWECFFSTKIDDQPEYIIETYVVRWSLEVTYQEVREHLGLETTKNWSKKSVQRTVPCLLGAFSVITLCFERICVEKTPTPQTQAWYQKNELTFADAILAVRKQLWGRLIIHDSTSDGTVIKISKVKWEFLSNRLSETG